MRACVRVSFSFLILNCTFWILNFKFRFIHWILIFDFCVFNFELSFFNFEIYVEQETRDWKYSAWISRNRNLIFILLFCNIIANIIICDSDHRKYHELRALLANLAFVMLWVVRCICWQLISSRTVLNFTYSLTDRLWFSVLFKNREKK